MGESNEFRLLFAAAEKFMRLGCWRWMYDTDIFGVENPITKEIGYCCVLGYGGQVYALAVYQGDEGLETLLKMNSTTSFSNELEVLHLQRCLIASFENRRHLEKKDIELINKLGINYQPETRLPKFRSYQPGYYPWDLNVNDVSFLTHALQQTVHVASRFRANRSLLRRLPKNEFLVRVAQKEKGRLIWRDKQVKPVPKKKTENANLPVDELALQRIKKNCFNRLGTVEVDYFFGPGLVQDGQRRPFYPYIFMMVGRDSGKNLLTHIARHANHLLEFREKFLLFAETSRVIPSEILIKQENMRHLFAPLAAKLGIKLTYVNQLQFIETIKQDMFNLFYPRKRLHDNEFIV